MDDLNAYTPASMPMSSDYCRKAQSLQTFLFLQCILAMVSRLSGISVIKSSDTYSKTLKKNTDLCLDRVWFGFARYWECKACRSSYGCSEEVAPVLRWAPNFSPYEYSSYYQAMQADKCQSGKNYVNPLALNTPCEMLPWATDSKTCTKLPSLVLMFPKIFNVDF